VVVIGGMIWYVMESLPEIMFPGLNEGVSGLDV
jgi:hypothetical protein